MTHRENFHRMMRGEPYERVPFDLPMTPPMVDETERRMGTRDVVAAFDLDFDHVYGGSPRNRDAWRAAYAEKGVAVPEGAWVSDTGFVEKPGDASSLGDAYHLTEMFHPLAGVQTLDELLTFPWHDLSDPKLVEVFPAQIDRIQAQGRVAVCSLECTVFESTWYLRGMPELFEDLYEENGIGDWLLDRFTERSVRFARASAEAGVDLIRLGDDIGTQRGMMMSVPFWRQHLKPRLAKVTEAAKSVPNPPYLHYHSDGDISDVVDDLIEIGIDVLNPVQPECMDIDEVAPRWKEKLCFSGMIGTQTTMPFGNPDDVRAAVAKCERWVHQGARMIIAPTHVLEPDVPWENVLALESAVRAIRPSAVITG